MKSVTMRIWIWWKEDEREWIRVDRQNASGSGRFAANNVCMFTANLSAGSVMIAVANAATLAGQLSHLLRVGQRLVLFVVRGHASWLLARAAFLREHRETRESKLHRARRE